LTLIFLPLKFALSLIKLSLKILLTLILKINLLLNFLLSLAHFFFSEGSLSCSTPEALFFLGLLDFFLLSALRILVSLSRLLLLLLLLVLGRLFILTVNLSVLGTIVVVMVDISCLMLMLMLREMTVHLPHALIMSVAWLMVAVHLTMEVRLAVSVLSQQIVARLVVVSSIKTVLVLKRVINSTDMSISDVFIMDALAAANLLVANWAVIISTTHKRLPLGFVGVLNMLTVLGVTSVIDLRLGVAKIQLLDDLILQVHELSETHFFGC